MTSADYAKRTSISVDKWIEFLRTKPAYIYKTTNWYKALKALEAETHPPSQPAPVPPVVATRAQFVLFAAQEPEKALGTASKYTLAFSADFAYRTETLATTVKAYRDKGHMVAGWCDCRPAPTGTPASIGVEFVRDYGLDYFIGQCEDADQFDDAYKNGARVMVGNRSALRQDQIAHLTTDVALIQERYWNEGWATDPSPDIAAYCNGIYPTALWNPTIQQYKDSGRWRSGDGLYHVAAVEDWQNLP